MNNLIKYSFILLSLFILSGCASTTYISADSDLLKNDDISRNTSTYRIGVDDTVQINVWKNVELSVTVPVRPDGNISMPLIGDVKAAGLSPETVAMSIREQLKSYIRDPNVTVMVTGLHSHEYLTRVRVTGAVVTPRTFNFRQGMTVLDAVLESGGVNDFASANNTKLYRMIDGKNRIIKIYLEDILYKGKVESNIKLKPGDIVTVPERLF